MFCKSFFIGDGLGVLFFSNSAKLYIEVRLNNNVGYYYQDVIIEKFYLFQILFKFGFSLHMLIYIIDTQINTLWRLYHYASIKPP